ncbi:hypothetical protein V4R08_15090 [Nitrobacter sp. NHB1]
MTPDGRYFVVRGRLWRMANPSLDETKRGDLVRRLMAARRAVHDAKMNTDLKTEAAAHHAVDEVKRALGERRPVWWTDGSPTSIGTWPKTRHTPNGTRKSGPHSSSLALSLRSFT